MTSAQRRIALAVCLIVGMSLLMSAGLTFLVSPMAEELGLADNLVEDVLAIPSAAALLVVFSAGQLGDRLGARRTLVISGIAFSGGALLVMLAGNAYAVELGLAICAAAAVTMQIVGVSLLQQATGDGPAQVSAFTLFGMVFPLAFLVFPVATSRLLEVSSWRLVPLVWVLAGIGMVAVSLIMLDAGERAADVGEWVTPLLAGMAFAAGARAVSELDDIRLDPPLIAWSAVVCAVAAVGCLMAKRRIRQATFTTRPVRGRQLPLLLVAIALVSLSGLLTFVSIALEYLYALSAYEAAIAVVPAQVGAILGARFMARYAIGRWGRVRAARILMLALAAGMLPLLLLRVGTPLWLLVGTATIFSFMWMAVLTVLNAEVMRRAPQGHTGAVSSFRTAASSLGAAVGVGILGTIVISSVPVEAGVAAVTADDLTGLTNSLRLDGLLASLVAVAGWIVLGFVSRRSAPDPAAAGETR